MKLQLVVFPNQFLIITVFAVFKRLLIVFFFQLSFYYYYIFFTSNVHYNFANAKYSWDTILTHF